MRKVEERLRRTLLFSDAVTNPILFSLAKNCRITELHAGETFQGDPEHLHLIGKGRLSMVGKEGAPVLGKGEFWGSDSLFQSMSPNAQGQQPAPDPLPPAIGLDSCEIYSVPLRLVARIPVVRWKLFDAFRNTHPYSAPRYRGTAR